MSTKTSPLRRDLPPLTFKAVEDEPEVTVLHPSVGWPLWDEAVSRWDRYESSKRSLLGLSADEIEAASKAKAQELGL